MHKLLARHAKLLQTIAVIALPTFVCFNWILRSQIERTEISFQGTRRKLDALLAERKEKCDTLVVYLHGLGGSILEPFKNPSQKRNYASAAFDMGDLKAKFSAIDFGIPGVWVHGQDFEDITLGITALLKRTGAKRIILAGSSMGGSAALTYAAKAPNQIKSKVIGVVAIYPVGDFEGLYRQTKAPEITLSMNMAFDGGPDQHASEYSANSLKPYLNDLWPTCRIYVISAEADVVAPRQLQLDLVKELKEHNIPVELESLATVHLKPPPRESFVRGLTFVVAKQRP